ncbi:hypothetical protein UFOVP23_46 [uncultured Caudovirales phage]|uniref:Uncharacterized protein n=1 Tax=uncultured Caudovirales phage TaxID=2100421 RepID=A0A6J5T9Y1_9CAUD|nr:hypothetical protein UFOVP23_46 [uncultured Caudovirales phage]
MPISQNTSPIYTLPTGPSWGTVTTADNTQDGTSGNTIVCFTAGANGGYLQKVICQPISTSGSTATFAAAIRVYLNNGSTPGTAANNVLIREFSAPALNVNVASQTGTLAVEIPFNIQIAAAYVIYVGVTSFQTNTAWKVYGVGGSY